MKTSTTESPKSPEPKSILIQGPPGGGKTTLMLQFPDLEYFDLDLNMDGPERFLRKERKLDLSYSYEQIPLKDDGTPRPVEDCYDYLISQLKLCKSSPSKWVGLDGLTAVNEYIIRKILHEQRKSEMEARHWQPFKSLALSLLIGTLRHLGKNVLVACHETKLTKPDPKQVMQETVLAYEPFFQGKVGDMLGAFFTDVWSIKGEAAPGGRSEFVLSTNKTSLRDLKNSLGLPSEIKNPTYETLKPFLL